ncbi:MAG TPA: hypothetical protein VJ860_04085 [Polyangia bacterium]|nr:hypothetical protein [Polyangia bacterium]
MGSRAALVALTGLALALLLVVASRIPAARSLPTHSQTGEPVPSSSFETAPGPDAADVKQRGVALGLFAEDVSFSYAPLLQEIAALGATHVSLVVPLYQTHGASTALKLHTRLSPTLEAVADAIRFSRRAGLEVTLFPIVRLSEPRSPKDWRGTLAPGDRDAWFASYGALLADLASLGALTGASRLVVGSELSSLDGDLVHWRPLVERIRALFTGTLMYSANWDHYQDARLYDLVDEIGVVAYFNLREKDGPSDVPALTARWRNLRREIEFNLSVHAKPFVLTELGYRSRTGATAAPWDEVQGGAPDVDEQARAFQAFRQAWTARGQAPPHLAGLYVWNWYGYGGRETTSYTPRGKPAVEVIRQILDEM